MLTHARVSIKVNSISHDTVGVTFAFTMYCTSILMTVRITLQWLYNMQYNGFTNFCGATHKIQLRVWICKTRKCRCGKKWNNMANMLVILLCMVQSILCNETSCFIMVLKLFLWLSARVVDSSMANFTPSVQGKGIAYTARHPKLNILPNFKHKNCFICPNSLRDFYKIFIVSEPCHTKSTTKFEDSL